MENKISTYSYLMIVLCICSLCISCKQASSSAYNGVVITKEKKTQALLLTQDMAFDADNKDRVVGDYVQQQKVEIPTKLTPQNKWMMFEGPVLENELVAYRYYADSRHRFDIYGKTVSDLVMDTVSWDYHNIMDWGSDILKVGNSLGLGSPAIWHKDSLYTLSDCTSKVIEIIENGNDRSMIRTSFSGLSIDEHTFDLVQDWSIESGQPWSEITLKVAGGSLPKGMKFATGIVKHLPEIIQGESNGTFYALNWGKQSFHNENMGMAIVASKSYAPTHVNDDLSHTFIFDKAETQVSYRFLSAWERDANKVHNSSEFEMLVEASIPTDN
jgi:hypothetical protein